MNINAIRREITGQLETTTSEEILARGLAAICVRLERIMAVLETPTARSVNVDVEFPCRDQIVRLDGWGGHDVA